MLKTHTNEWRNYLEDGFGLTIDLDENWQLAHKDEVFSGHGDRQLIAVLHNLKKRYDLQLHGKATYDTILIYTDNLLKVIGLLRNQDCEKFGNIYLRIENHFEFREITRFKELTDCVEIADYAQYLFDNLFIPDQCAYLTPNQVPRKRIKKARKNMNDMTAQNLFPTSFAQYEVFRKALFGGMVYVPYKNVVIDQPMMCLDLTSAYIYDLVIEKHCYIGPKSVDSQLWELYLRNDVKSSLGCYKLKYSCPSTKIHCFKNIDGENFKSGEHIVNAILTSVDLETIMEIAHVTEIECFWLKEFEMNDLPRYMLDEIVKQYATKVSLKNDKQAYNLQKPILNGIFGDCIVKYDEASYIKTYKNTPSIAPEWGIWCCAYARKNLLKLANKVAGWIYSDTDSIYCYDTEENRRLAEEYNNQARAKVKAFCEKYGYDYELLKDLGTFKVEKTIKKFKAITQKAYMYQTTDDEFKLVAAGLNQDTIDVTPELFDKPTLNYGSRTYKYVDENGYHEKVMHNEEATMLAILQAANTKPQY